MGKMKGKAIIVSPFTKTWNIHAIPLQYLS